MSTPLGQETKIGAEALAVMRERGGTWAVYQNHDLGHRDLGHLQFLKVGDGCTFKTAPERMPDTETHINWRYVLIGAVNLETGEVETR